MGSVGGVGSMGSKSSYYKQAIAPPKTTEFEERSRSVAVAILLFSWRS
ncbi:hypothetical protein [Okeania sp. KiyG1]|nr:hypothetical protein [Okeania sp. KiyG1]